MDDDFEHPAAGLKPAASRVAASVLGLVRARLELVSVELAEERGRLQSLVVLAVAAGILAALAIAVASLAVVVYFWETYRYLSIAGLAAIYAVLAALAFLRITSIVRGEMPFAATIAEFEKDRSRLAGDPIPPPPAPPPRAP
jgi:uncharacterized membrane protein YqjE